ncbi:uncharacterized protein FA14DRAFT_160760 [Meira miltonrushii]|uniref:Uncharacterized protein n=1 Tax=Meira miltonrushii TaxID=1280837 RepID=A0A316VHC3_9BASI|nr:uncharacterized protein FA14DRAFT_160760 [Meira miltonrushii]PWN35733.1 hypothetical protein FA14DRAFT_160760 [Meira miltonrushii]
MTKRIHPSLGLPGDVVSYTPNDVIQTPEEKEVAKEPIKVQVPTAEIVNIFAHRQWRAGMLLADLIWSQCIPLQDEIVGEFGAGTGLPSIASAKFGKARFTLSTDYDSPSLISILTKNVKDNVSTDQWQSRIRVIGHTWGKSIGDVEDAFPYSLKADKFDVLLLADCIWDDLSHNWLIKSIVHLLAKNQDSRVYMVSGLHTGREKIIAFIRRMHKAGLKLTQFPQTSRMEQSLWPALEEDESIKQKQELDRLRNDEAICDSPELVMECELAWHEEEENFPTAIETESGAQQRQWHSSQARLSGQRRSFVELERPEERKEAAGVHLRNRWITFMAFSWQ